MGLDSVELVMEIEKYFGIRIPDPEAEKIYTVQLMVDSVAQHLNILNDGTELKSKIFERVDEAINKCNSPKEIINLSDIISKHVFWEDKEWWKVFKNILNLKVPKPDSFRPTSTKISHQLRSLINWTPNYNSESITFDQFVTAICGINYKELIDNTHIKDKYEIYVAVMGITVDKIGVDFYEIAPDKYFTSDLGVD